jgi:hypothetical protein
MAQTNQHLSKPKYLSAQSGHAHGIIMSCGQWPTPPPVPLVRFR